MPPSWATDPDHRARLLAGRRTKLLGVTLSLPNPFHADLVEAIYRAADALGYQVVLSAVTAGRTPAASRSTPCWPIAARRRVLVGPLLPARPFEALATELPVVVVGQPARAAGVDVVRADDGAGVGAGGPASGRARPSSDLARGRRPRRRRATERRYGYRAAMRRAGLAEEHR